ncbi:uncharacterized protein LOC130992349 [Salvia miltiorrhiza]|uniref:uncharacterized protein LOC130992349 n=1 Tax=Salvia miltiorrhiza TaxID=226208 RepID=UPI0025ACA124|nr:uncharacterized protein LOC130992349 [Salvia miltiorrhiza]
MAQQQVKFQQETQKFMMETRGGMQNVNAQLSHLAQAVARLESKQGELPAQVEVKKVNAVTLRNGTMKVDKAMLDFGASINVMPLSMYQDLEIGQLKPTRVVIQLANRSNVYPEGILEDVLVKVEELIFPADFYILDMGKSKARDPVMLLGRPFLKTVRTRIDCDTGKLICQFEGEQVTFDIYNAMKHPADTDKGILN